MGKRRRSTGCKLSKIYIYLVSNDITELSELTNTKWCNRFVTCFFHVNHQHGGNHTQAFVSLNILIKCLCKA